MEKKVYVGKNIEDAVNQAKIDMQEQEENLLIIEKEVKQGLFKNKKVEIEVFQKREINDFIKEYLRNLIRNIGLTGEIEVKSKENFNTYTMFSNNNAILIGKNGKTLESINLLLKQVLFSKLGTYYGFMLDVGEYRQKHEKTLEREVKYIAQEVFKTGISAKLDPMNSYERRLVHTILSDNNNVYTESEGEEPNRCIVIKKKEEK
ncbi:MAG: hypothetical protein PHQ64_00350 [Bacilli bacterium]|nr:hypothetical protein [Bacilli bacterium]